MNSSRVARALAGSKVRPETFAAVSRGLGASGVMAVLTDTAVPTAKKIAAIEKCLKEPELKESLTVITSFVEAGRAKELPALFSRAADICLREFGAHFVTVTSSVPLSSETRKSAEKAAKSMGAAENSSIYEIVDERIVAGLQIQIGATVIDNTTHTHLSALS